MRKVWIEAALNGPWSRRFQPGIPDTVEKIVAEAVACAHAGATIIHAHAYDGVGPQTHEDAPLGTRASNLEMVEEAVRMAGELGAEPATPGEMRQALAGHDL
jgi:uncharacterized protein (DUF849 family)